MEAPGNNQVPIQCRSGCGFYGTPATEGMCSKCYKDYLKKSQVPPSGLSGPSFRGGSDVVTVGGGASSSASSPASGNLVTRAACVDTASPTVPVIGASGSASSSSSSRKASGGVEKDPKTDVSSVSGAIAAAVPEPAAAKSADAAGAGAAIAALSMDAEAPGSPSTSTDENSEKKKKNRCAICRKKVGLTGFGCRCGGLYCALHRYSDKHDCTFDYRAHGAEEIRRNNPVVKGEKIRQI